MAAITALAALLARLLMPDWLLTWFAVAAVVAAILSFRRAALVLGTLPIMSWLVMPMLATLMSPLPNWLPLATGAAVGLVLVLLGMKRSARLVTGLLAPRGKGRSRP